MCLNLMKSMARKMRQRSVNVRGETVVVVPRTPDYEWNAIVCPTPVNFDPENPN